MVHRYRQRAYLLRYGILDWSPTYLKEVKHFALDKSSSPTSCMNTRVFRARCCSGWMSDKSLPRRRGATGVSLFATSDYRDHRLLDEPGRKTRTLIYGMIIIGFLIYPVMLIGLHALELAPKKRRVRRRALPVCLVIWRFCRCKRHCGVGVPLTSSVGMAALCDDWRQHSWR